MTSRLPVHIHQCQLQLKTMSLTRWSSSPFENTTVIDMGISASDSRLGGVACVVPFRLQVWIVIIQMIRVSYESISNSSLNPSPRNGSMFLRLFGSGSAEVHFTYLSRDEVVCLSETFPRKMQCFRLCQRGHQTTGRRNTRPAPSHRHVLVLRCLVPARAPIVIVKPKWSSIFHRLPSSLFTWPGTSGDATLPLSHVTEERTTGSSGEMMPHFGSADGGSEPEPLSEFQKSISAVERNSFPTRSLLIRR